MFRLSTNAPARQLANSNQQANGGCDRENQIHRSYCVERCRNFVSGEVGVGQVVLSAELGVHGLRRHVDHHNVAIGVTHLWRVGREVRLEPPASERRCEPCRGLTAVEADVQGPYDDTHHRRGLMNEVGGGHEHRMVARAKAGEVCHHRVDRELVDACGIGGTPRDHDWTVDVGAKTGVESGEATRRRRPLQTNQHESHTGGAGHA